MNKNYKTCEKKPYYQDMCNVVYCLLVEFTELVF